ncbi:disulfide bond formation protein B [Pseudochelatococcus sp. G4_1912]|uniref:disulfide bond formation protein B n=1 Tax=Pseudochelatococcus sp. G4_1912 TaxID=3114288 RepID=UPI0039C72162
MLSLRGNAAAFNAAIVVLVISTLAIAGAFYFQFVMHLPPCPLCLIQRWPFYAAIPVSVVAAYCARPASASAAVARVLLGMLALGFLVGAGVAAFHAGVEWKFWSGLESCSGTLSIVNDADAFLQRLQTVQVTRCDEAAWRLGGLSLAGWNVLVSLALAGIAAVGALRHR